MFSINVTVEKTNKSAQTNYFAAGRSTARKTTKQLHQKRSKSKNEHG